MAVMLRRAVLGRRKIRGTVIQGESAGQHKINRPQFKVTLRLAVIQSVCLGFQPHSVDYGQIVFTIKQVTFTSLLQAL
jgi:hypothetical protein